MMLLPLLMMMSVRAARFVFFCSSTFHTMWMEWDGGGHNISSLFLLDRIHPAFIFVCWNDSVIIIIPANTLGTLPMDLHGTHTTNERASHRKKELSWDVFFFICALVLLRAAHRRCTLYTHTYTHRKYLTSIRVPIYLTLIAWPFSIHWNIISTFNDIEDWACAFFSDFWKVAVACLLLWTLHIDWECTCRDGWCTAK